MTDIYVKPKKGESFESMFRRWSRRIQKSGKKYTIQDRLFHAKSPSKNKRRASKLRSLKKAEKREWMLRTGKIEPRRRRGRRR